MTRYIIQTVTIRNKTEIGVIRIDDSGQEWSLGDGELDTGYLAWLAEDNTPEEWSTE